MSVTRYEGPPNPRAIARKIKLEEDQEAAEAVFADVLSGKFTRERIEKELSEISNQKIVLKDEEITPKINLHGANLSGLDLSGLDLSGANLHGANLEDANLNNCNLEGANLHGANLHNVKANDVKLNKANLCSACLCNGLFYNSNLSESNMSECCIEDTEGLDYFEKPASEANELLSKGNSVVIRNEKAWLLGKNLKSANLSKVSETHGSGIVIVE
jgi:uncharacterized protein YjbI with pentapeptide repeats